MSNDVFNDQIVRTLAEILNETHLTEIEYEMGQVRVRVVRQTVAPISQSHTPTPFVTSSPLPVASPTIPVVPIVSSADQILKHPGLVKSPMVGTAYSASSPQSAPFIQVGTRVSKGETILIIEAMKVMNQIKAPTDGKVTEIFFQDGDPLEYDQPLLILES